MANQVNDYIEKQKSPQKEIIQKVRTIFQITQKSLITGKGNYWSSRRFKLGPRHF